MINEHIDYGYTGTIAIPKEVKNMKNTILTLCGIRFTAKQLVLTIIAFVVGFVVFKICMILNLPTIAIVGSVFSAAPFIILAFIRKHGLEYDTWLMVKRANTRLSNSIRKNEGLNEYEKLEDLYDHAMKNKQKKRKVEKKKKSQVRAFI